jgi:uncharacterized protein
MLKKEDFEKVPENVPTWFREEYSYWEQVVSQKSFPCHFGTNAEKKGQLRYTYIEDHDLSQLPYILRDFMHLSRENKKNRHALVVFVQPEEPEQTFEYYDKYFWDILKYLHSKDEKEWNKEIPEDPENPHWEFCFDGDPIFISANMPAYKNRTTRDLGKSLILIFQPRWIFADISHDSVGGQRAINLIRNRVEEIEELPIHPDLGGYGEKLEWKQYVITDDNNTRKGKCPFH